MAGPPLQTLPDSPRSKYGFLPIVKNQSLRNSWGVQTTQQQKNMKTKIKSIVGNPSGFSLVELLVVIAVIAIIAAIAIPNISNITGVAEDSRDMRNAQNIASTASAAIAAGYVPDWNNETDAVNALIAGVSPTDGAFSDSEFRVDGINPGDVADIVRHLGYDNETDMVLYDPQSE